MLAWDVPVYREAFARIGGCIAAAVCHDSVYTYEGRLRGQTHHGRGGARPAFVGRGVTLVGRDRIDLADQTSLYGWNFLNAGRNGHVRIGANTRVDVFSILYGQGGLSIGAGCAIAGNVTIYSQSNQYRATPGRQILDQPIRYAPVSIGDGVWIGAGAIILPGVTIGNHAVVSAGALVRSDVPARAVVAGVPARQIGTRPGDLGAQGDRAV